MKTKDLITRLQAVDPTGETEVCVGNADIHFLDREPAYYDGCLQVLERDPRKEPFYSLTGITYVASGEKIDIKVCAAEDVFLANPDAAAHFVGMTAAQEVEYRALVEKLRQDSRSVLQQCECDMFVAWVKQRYPNASHITLNNAYWFCAKTFSYTDPLPRPIPTGKSYFDRRSEQWAYTVDTVDVGNGDMAFILRTAP